ncbi:MAG: hypothetical protein MJ145_01545 [Clostridia bacterium]|nr:hypothetical protein [Clostridia bacterium]
MRLNKGIENCNGCEACIVACKKVCIKLEDYNHETKDEKNPVVNLDGCLKCNSCKLHCPIFWPVTMPEFTEMLPPNDGYYYREMAPIYRKTMQSVNARNFTEFTGTLCQIAALISLMGDKIPTNLKFNPVACDPEANGRECCKNCMFYK